MALVKKWVSNRFILLFISAILWESSFWSSKTAWLIWFSFVPVLVNIVQEERKWHCSLRDGLIFGFIFFLFDFSWLKYINILSWISVAFFQPFFIALWVLLVQFSISKSRSNSWRRILTPPLAWIVVEWLRAQGPFGVEWGAPAYTQHTNIFVLQWASIIGPYGVSGIILLVNALIAEGWKSFKTERQFPIWWKAAAGTFLFVVIVGFFLLPGREDSVPRLRVALLQPGVSQQEKWDPFNAGKNYKILEQMVIEAKRSKVDLVVFPETAVPDRLNYNLFLLSMVTSWAKDNSLNLLVGGNEVQGNKEWNSLFLIDAKGALLGQYRKQHLVPFGEYMPWPFGILKGRIPILDLVPDYSAGDTVPIFITKGVPWSALICFESTMPGFARAAVNAGAELLIVATNDAWFERSLAPSIHAAMGAFRAVENRVPFVQAANTGISVVIAPDGRIITKSNLFDRTVLIGEIGLYSGPTFYGKMGDWIVLLSIIILLMLCFLKNHEKLN